MKTVTVGTIMGALPTETQAAVLEIMNRPIEVFDMPKLLRPILAPYAAELERVGLLADYVAYVVLPGVVLHFRSEKAPLIDAEILRRAHLN